MQNRWWNLESTQQVKRPATVPASWLSLFCIFLVAKIVKSFRNNKLSGQNLIVG